MLKLCGLIDQLSTRFLFKFYLDSDENSLCCMFSKSSLNFKQFFAQNEGSASLLSITLWQSSFFTWKFDSWWLLQFFTVWKAHIVFRWWVIELQGFEYWLCFVSIVDLYFDHSKSMHKTQPELKGFLLFFCGSTGCLHTSLQQENWHFYFVSVVIFKSWPWSSALFLFTAIFVEIWYLHWYEGWKCAILGIDR